MFFESPNRIAACLTSAAEVLGADRPAAVCRELTKAYEEIRRARWASLRPVMWTKTSAAKSCW
jgi:16S rRNA (cytidine1402-2'-O)-methyltransferase